MEVEIMAKKFGLSANRCFFLGRVVGTPEMTGEWCKLYFKTIVPENNNGEWNEVECVVPLMTNNPKTINTIQQFVQDERQLYVEGFAKGWQEGNGFNCGIMINTIKLGSKVMFDPDIQGGAQNAVQGQGMPNSQAGGSMPGFPAG
jgi:hypothetical protein